MDNGKASRFCLRSVACRVAFCFAVFAAMLMPAAAYADEYDLLKVELSSSAQSCVSGDEIELSATVTNEGDSDAYDATYELVLPDSLVAESPSGTLDAIAPGESKDIKFAVRAFEPEVSGVAVEGEGTGADGSAGGAPATGDGSIAVIAVLVSAFILAMFGIVLARKKSRHSVLMGCLVVAVAVAAAVPAAAFADSISRNTEGSVDIEVNGESATAYLSVAYLANSGQGGSDSDDSDSGSGDLEEGIVLKPGVVEIQPEHWVELSSGDRTATVDAEAASLLKDGSVAVFYPGNGNNEGMSMRVSSVSQVGSSFVVSGSDVQLDDVVESINLSGETSETLSYEVAEGVSVEDGSEIAVASEAMPYEDEYGIAPLASFDGEKNIGQLKLNVFDGATLTASPSVIYSFRYEHGQVSKCKLAIKNEYKFDFEWSAKKDFKTKLLTATYATSVPGLTVTADLYLVGSASGEVSIDATVTGTSGIDYSDGDLNMISDADFSYEASFEALLKAGVKPTAIMKFVGLGLADIDAEVGASVSGSLNQRSASFVCADMAAWMYVDVSAGTQETALSKMMDLLKLKKEYHPLDKSNSPQWNIHCENGELVDKCTWGQEDQQVDVEVANQTISYGISSAAIIKSDGSLWTKGDNFYGQLGNSDDSLEKSDEFIKIMDDVRSVDGCTAIKKDGSLWAWGPAFNGDFASGTMSVPVKVADNVANASGGGVYVKDDGSLWKFGFYADEASGAIKKLTDQRRIADGVRSARSTYSRIVFLKDDGTVWQVAKGSESVDNAQMIANDVRKIASGGDQGMIVKKDGSLYSWDFRKGVSSLKKESLDDVVDACSYYNGPGGYSYLALTENGSVMVWGDNFAGTLGTGDEVSRSTPTEILSGVSQISMGNGQGIALKCDGSVYAWGPGWYGDKDSYCGYVAQSKTPVKIADGVLVP